ncbi:MAG: PDDEXK nuclease domain-containing protein [Rhodococcus sp. (in: high G+C Gram-positive bacteria)]|uniref:PDDEXK nuclease domain-containing protein n=1 Tax=Rhodococcus sp. TaxID=1831 RepID=UPI003BB78B7C
MTNPAALPDDYPRFLDQLKGHVRQARTQAARTVNTELLVLYWDLGRALADKQQAQGWGTRVIDRLAEDLRSEFPHMRGLSRSNLFYMRQLATVWPRTAIVQHSVGRLPWGHVTVLLDKLDGLDDRNWYADRAAEHGWSRNVLTNQIAGGLHRRIGAAPSNFPDHLPTEESDLAQQLVRDPYVFDFLNLTERVAERDLEAALMSRLEAFLLELGHGFAFIGRQYHFSVDGDDFYIDLLFFNWLQSRFVVVELKIGRFEPEYAGKLGFYVSWVDENLRVPDQHAATIGILLCAGRNDNVVRYSLAGTTAPLAVANYTYDTLPDPIRELVPTDNELATAVDATWNELDTAHGVTDEH